jgi:hypothetical protein
VGRTNGRCWLRQLYVSPGSHRFVLLMVFTVSISLFISTLLYDYSVIRGEIRRSRVFLLFYV